MINSVHCSQRLALAEKLLFLTATLFVTVAAPLRAEVLFQTLYSFGQDAQTTNGEYGSMVTLVQASDGNFYGATAWDLNTGNAHSSIFSIGINRPFIRYTNLVYAPGAYAYGSLVQANDRNLYGVAPAVPAYTDEGLKSLTFGSIFRFANGEATTLHIFADGASPFGGLVSANDGKLYGIASGTIYKTNAAVPTNGIVFCITTNGTFNTLHNFTGGNDGSGPASDLVQANDGNFYGLSKGETGYIVFRLTPQGTLTPLAAIKTSNSLYDPFGKHDELMQANDGNLYLSSFWEGVSTNGALLRVTTDGVVSTLYSFSGGADGSHPAGRLTQASDGYLYGTTAGEWSWGSITAGTIFRISTNGTFVTIHSFALNGEYEKGGIGGSNPYAGLTQAGDGYLYGTTAFGGLLNQGTVFRIRVTPPVLLLLPKSGENFRFAFSTLPGQNYAIQQTPALAINWLPYTNLIGDGSLISVTFPMTNNPAHFFRVHEL